MTETSQVEECCVSPECTKQVSAECTNVGCQDGLPVNLEVQCNANKKSNTKFYEICQNDIT